MESSELKFDLKQVKKDLIQGISECSQRGLFHSVKWLSEMNFAISHVKLPPEDYPHFTVSYNDETYLMAKSYFDLKEYDRCAYFTENCTDNKNRFLNLYSKYLSIEKKKLDTMTDSNCPPDPTKNASLRDLCTILKEDHLLHKLDGFCLYLYGVVLKKLDLNSLAMDIFVESINEQPLHWGSWQELALLVPDKNTLLSLPLPDHWMKYFFLAQVYLEQLNNEALEIYYNLHSQGFEMSTYIKAQMAIAYHNRRGSLCLIIVFNRLL